MSPYCQPLYFYDISDCKRIVLFIMLLFLFQYAKYVEPSTSSKPIPYPWKLFNQSLLHYAIILHGNSSQVFYLYHVYILIPNEKTERSGLALLLYQCIEMFYYSGSSQLSPSCNCRLSLLVFISLTQESYQLP